MRDHIDIEMENVSFLLNACKPDTYFTHHIANSTSNVIKSTLCTIIKSVTENNVTYAYNAKAAISTKNVITNFEPNLGVPAIQADTVASVGKADGTTFVARPIGFSYFNTTLDKPLWIKSIAQDGSYTWVDVNGTEYESDNTPVT